MKCDDEFKNKYIQNERFTPLCGLFPLCPLIDNHNINCTIQFLLASEHFKNIIVHSRHLNFWIFHCLKELNKLKIIVQQRKLEIQNENPIFKSYVSRNITNMLAFFVSIDPKNEISYADKNWDDPLHIIIGVISMNFDKKPINYDKIYRSSRGREFICSKCKISIKKFSKSESHAIFSFVNQRCESLKEQLEKKFTNPKKIIKNTGERSAICRMFHKWSEIKGLEILISPIILFLEATYETTDHEIELNLQALSIPQDISIHESPYNLKACILRHKKSNGELSFSVLLCEKSRWYHQMDHLGKPILNISTILNDNRDIKYLLFEMSMKNDPSE